MIKTNENGTLTSIDESKPNDKLYLYPNPVDDVLTVENPGSEKLELTIYNSEGKLIRQKDYQDNKININLGNCRSGLYYLKIVTRDNVFSKKIIKK